MEFLLPLLANPYYSLAFCHPGLKFLLNQISVKILFCWPLWYSDIRSWIVVRQKCGFKFVSVTFLLGNLTKVNFNVLLHSWLTLGTNIPYCTMKVAQLCLTLWDPMDCSPPPPRLLCLWRFSRQELLSGFTVPSCRESSQPRDWIPVSCIAGGFFTNWATREALKQTYYCLFHVNVVMIKWFL